MPYGGGPWGDPTADTVSIQDIFTNNILKGLYTTAMVYSPSLRLQQYLETVR